jgi:hypothetical protein
VSLLEQLSDLYDQELLNVIKNGREVVDRDGNVQRIQATAADLNVIRQRLKDCGITAVPTSNNPIANIVAEMQKRKEGLPPIDESDDAATA